MKSGASVLRVRLVGWIYALHWDAETHKHLKKVINTQKQTY